MYIILTYGIWYILCLHENKHYLKKGEKKQKGQITRLQVLGQTTEFYILFYNKTLKS